MLFARRGCRDRPGQEDRRGALQKGLCRGPLVGGTFVQRPELFKAVVCMVPLLDIGKPVYYYENTEGGHAAAAKLNQRAYMSALNYAYLWMMLQ